MCVCLCILIVEDALCSGLGSIIGVVTGYGLDGPGIKSRWGARFSTPVQTGRGAHPASCTMGTGSFPGVKSDQVMSPHPFLVLWSRKSRAIPILTLWAIRPVPVQGYTLPFFMRYVSCEFKRSYQGRNWLALR